jgi:chemotaxis protein methyltransferase CheR
MNTCHELLQDILPKLGYRWAGFRKVRRQICRRIHRRMQDLGINNYHQYMKYIEEHTDEQRLFDSMLDITITRFWRDRGVFRLIETSIFPELISEAEHEKRTHLRCWSAGCCNGEEAYSLSLLWYLRLSPANMNIEIIATDRNETVLERATNGRFPEGALRDTPADILSSGFLKTGAGYFINDRYKNPVQFLRQDIRDEMPSGEFGLILCRNLIFTYFDIQNQERLLGEMLLRLQPGGYFIIGSNERLPPGNKNLEQVKTGEPVYRYRHLNRTGGV